VVTENWKVWGRSNVSWQTVSDIITSYRLGSWPNGSASCTPSVVGYHSKEAKIKRGYGKEPDRKRMGIITYSEQCQLHDGFWHFHLNRSVIANLIWPQPPPHRPCFLLLVFYSCNKDGVYFNCWKYGVNIPFRLDCMHLCLNFVFWQGIADHALLWDVFVENDPKNSIWGHLETQKAPVAHKARLLRRERRILVQLLFGLLAGQRENRKILEFLNFKGFRSVPRPLFHPIAATVIHGSRMVNMIDINYFHVNRSIDVRSLGTWIFGLPFELQMAYTNLPCTTVQAVINKMSYYSKL
jgi:hypothetical protein